MKTQQEIEQLGNDYAIGKSSSDVFKDAHKNDFIQGYTQCQEDMQTLLNDLFSLWQSLAEVGEISVGKNFTKKYEELKNKLNKQD